MCLSIVSLLCSTLYEVPADGLWGNIVDEKNNTWNGIVQLLKEKAADLCTAELSLTPERASVIRFGTVMMSSKMSIITKVLPAVQNLDLMAFLKIFHIQSWMVYLVYILGFALVMTAVQNIFKSPCLGIAGNLSSLLIYSLQLGEVGVQNVPGAMTIKILTISALFMLYIVYSFYAAFLTSLMSLKSEQWKIDSFDDLITQGYSIITMKESFIHSVMKDFAIKDASIAQLVDNMDSERDYLNSYFEIGERLKSSKSVVIASKDKTKDMGAGLIQFHSKLSKYFPAQRGGFGYPTDSEFADCFDYHLNKMKESGVLGDIMAKWAIKGNSGKRSHQGRKESIPESAFPINLQNVAFLVLVLLIGCGSSVLLCALEIAVSTIHKGFFSAQTK